jgi:Nucleoporin autopeptidase
LSVLREIVEIDRGRVTVYPDGSKHPPPGVGLNMPAEVTMEKLYPPSNGELEKYTNDFRSKPNTEFVSYDSETGIWRFVVEHFSTVSVVTGHSPETGDFIMKARSVRDTSANRIKKQRERTARAVFNKIMEGCKTEKLPPSDEEQRHLNSFLDVIDVDKFLAWYNESGVKGVSYTYNNGIIFDQIPGVLHEGIQAEFSCYFNRQINHFWGNAKPLMGRGSTSIFPFKLN